MNGTLETFIVVATFEKTVSFAISSFEPSSKPFTSASAVESLQATGSSVKVSVAFLSLINISFVSKPDPVNKILLPVLIM